MTLKQIFSWDSEKAEINLKKHGISFDRAAEIFLDPNVISRVDRIKDGEERWQPIGMIDGLFIILVAHTITTYSEQGDYIENIRIISARKADKKERRIYDNGYFWT